jgi:hypothetical protein
MAVAAQSEAWTVIARLNAEIMGSNPTQDMYVSVRLCCVYAVLCVRSGLATDWSPLQGVIPTVYIRLRMAADKSLVFPISNFPICSTTKRIFLDGLKKLEQWSHKCVELRGEYVE